MEKQNVAEKRQLLRAAFDKIDTDNSGYIEINEASAILKEIGVEADSSELKGFFDAIDANHDGKISFDELFTWFSSDKGQNLGSSNAFKLKLFSLMKKAKKEAKQISGNLKDQELGIDHHHIGFKIGNTDDSKTKLHLAGHFGTEAQTKFNAISNGLEITQPGAIILQFHSKNGETVKTQLLEILNSTKDLLSQFGVFPPDIDPSSISFTGAVDGEFVRIAIQIANEELVSILGQVEMMAGMFLPGDWAGSVSLDLHENATFGSLYKQDVEDNNPQPIPASLLDGLSFDFDARIPSSVIDIIKGQFADTGFQNLGDLKAVIPLLFLKKTDIQLDLASISSILKQIVPPELNFAIAVEQLKNIPLEQVLMMAPPLTEFIELAKEHLDTDFKIIVRGPLALASFHFKSEGLGTVWNALGK